MNAPKESHLSKQFTAQMQAAAPEGRSMALLDFLEERGQKLHYEEVTQLEHALQCAALAEAANVGHTLITSALLHDIGHLLVDEEDDQEEMMGRDSYHEETGADFLAMFFPPQVTDPIRLHVPAKRYLCTMNNDYWDSLSEASRQSLAVQGGKMSAQEKIRFEKNPDLNDALRLRIWDDQAKIPGRATLPLQHYTNMVRLCLTSN